MRWLLAAGTLLLCLPMAQAALDLSVDLSAGELKPGTDQATATVRVGLDCQQALLRARGTADSLPVPIKTSGSPAVVVSGNPVVNLPLEPCRKGEQATEVSAGYAVGVLAGAPANRPLGFNITAELPSDVPTLATAESKTVPLSVKAKPIVLVVVVQVPQALHLTQSNQTFLLSLANKGNTPVHVRVTPAFSSPDVRSYPAETDLGTEAIPGSGSPTADLRFSLEAPTMDKLPEFTGHLDIVAHAIEGGAPDTQVRADQFFRNEVAPPKSSPASPLVLAGLALLACARARRRP
ncbi:MAG TPA: hypothetical protein VM286_03160 [Candidatus Thermoplasmatota archaeon]|nr:hypothetical protein [Candidatus Thermoplasmatota archaeon]